MKNTRTLLSLLVGFLLVAMLAGCAAKEEAPPIPLDDAIATDLLWNYEMNLIGAVKEADPTKYVTDLEQQWLAQYQAKKKAGEQATVGWMTSGSYIQVDPKKVTSKGAEVVLKMETRSVSFKLVPVGGEWKVANHTTADGKWWAPAK